MKEAEEDPSAMALRHVREVEQNLAHQRAIVEEMVKDGRRREADQARRVLEAMQATLRIAREHLRMEQGQDNRNG